MLFPGHFLLQVLCGLVLLAIWAPLTPVAASTTAAPTPSPSAAGGRKPQPAQNDAPVPVPVPGPAKSLISGTVILDENLDGSADRGDRPLVGVSVAIVGPGVNAAASTSSSGGFAFSGLPAGTYALSLGLPGHMILNGSSREITVDGRGSGRADFFIARPERAPTPTVTPVPPTPTPVPPTATPVPTNSPQALPTAHVAVFPDENPVDSGGTGPLSPPEASRSASPRAAAILPASLPTSAVRAPLRPMVTSLQGLRYAPGREAPSMIQPIRRGTTTWLGVPFITQLDGTPYGGVNCGPASTAMVLGAFGVRTTPDYLRDYVNYVSGAYSLDVGTSLDHLSRVVREAGLEVTHLYGESGYLRWNTRLLREQIEAGRPIVTLVKYRALPGNSDSLSDFDHYIVIAGLSGSDFIYNDAAFSGDRGYGLLISPDDLERAWGYSSIPRHGMAIGLKGGAQPRQLDKPALPPSQTVTTSEIGQASPDGEAPDSVQDASERSELDGSSTEESAGDRLPDDSLSGLLFKRVMVDALPEVNPGSALQQSAGLSEAAEPDPEILPQLGAEHGPESALESAPAEAGVLESVAGASETSWTETLIWALFVAAGLLIVFLAARGGPASPEPVARHGVGSADPSTRQGFAPYQPGRSLANRRRTGGQWAELAMLITVGLSILILVYLARSGRTRD